MNNLFKKKSMPEKEHKISDHEFFLAVLYSVPDKSMIDFGQDEPERWIQELKPWAVWENRKRHEPDFYRVDPEFRKSVERLLKDTSDFYQIHHMSIIGPDKDELFWMNDNFTLMKLSDLISDKVAKIIGNAEPIASGSSQG